MTTTRTSATRRRSAGPCTCSARLRFTIEALLNPFKEFLSDEQHEELWEMVYMMQYELCQERDPAVEYMTPARTQVIEHRSGPRKSNPRPERPARSRKRRQK